MQLAKFKIYVTNWRIPTCHVWATLQLCVFRYVIHRSRMLERHPLVVLLLPLSRSCCSTGTNSVFLAVTMAAGLSEEEGSYSLLVEKSNTYSTNEDCCRPFTPCFGFGLCPCLDWLQGTCATFGSALLVHLRRQTQRP